MSNNLETKNKKKKFDRFDFLFLVIGIILGTCAFIPGKVY